MSIVQITQQLTVKPADPLFLSYTETATLSNGRELPCLATMARNGPCREGETPQPLDQWLKDARKVCADTWKHAYMVNKIAEAMAGEPVPAAPVAKREIVEKRSLDIDGESVEMTIERV